MAPLSIGHTTPAELVSAPWTTHMWTSTILLNSYPALRTFTHVFPAQVTKVADSIIIADILPMPRLVTSEASACPARLAINF